MNQHRLLRTLIVLSCLLLISCSVIASDVQVTETKSEITAVQEIVHLNNCGGKAETKQTAEHSFTTNLEGIAALKIGFEIIEGTVSARYGQFKNVSKKQELIAPAGTDMEFTLKWTEQQWFSTLTANGQSGTYKAQVPVSVELVSSRDLRTCDGSTPQAVVPAVSTSHQNRPAWQCLLNKSVASQFTALCQVTQKSDAHSRFSACLTDHTSSDTIRCRMSWRTYV